MIVYGDPLAVRFLCKTRASSRSAREHDTGSANSNTRTDGRVVLFNEVVLNQLDGQRGLADTTTTNNNLRSPSALRRQRR